MTDFKYSLNTTAGEHTVYGTQIGRFAVRKADASHPNAGRGSIEGTPWRIDHVPSGFVLLMFSTAQDAFVIADDISRFCLHDPSSKDMAEVQKQMGSPIVDWLKFHIKFAPVCMPFRKWLDEICGEPWHPRGRKWRQVTGIAS